MEYLEWFFYVQWIVVLILCLVDDGFMLHDDYRADRECCWWILYLVLQEQS